MRIRLSPQRREGSLVVSKTGDVLTIDGEAFDFSVIPDGATLPRDAIDCEWIAGDVERNGGDLIVPLILPHGPDPSEAVAFPADLNDPPDGPLLPIPGEGG